MLTYYYWPVKTGGAENQCRKLVSHLAGSEYSFRVLTVRHGKSKKFETDCGAQVVRVHNLESVLQSLKMLCSINKKAVTANARAKINFCIDQEQDSNNNSKIHLFFASAAATVVRYFNILFFSSGTLLFLFRNRRSIDILHVHTAEWIAGLAAFAGWIFKIPVVCKGANSPVFAPLQAVPLASYCERWRKKPNFIALTGAMKKDLMQNGVLEESITIIPNGVKTSEDRVQVEKLRDFLFIGNFSQTAAHKAFDVLIQAWSKVQSNRPGICLFMLGGGDNSKWRNLAAELKCESTIKFVGYQDDIEPYMKSCCCFLLPSRKEGISNALLEAQSYGLPAIVSDIPGNREIVKHGRNGHIVPVGDAEKLAKEIITLIDDGDLRKELGKAAKERIEKDFSMGSVARKTCELYKQLANG